MFGKTKAIVIGGGPAGLSTALRLQQRANISCSVYELRPEPTTMGGAVWILPNGLRLLDRLGVYDKLKTCGNSHSNIVIHSMQGSVLAEHDLAGSARDQTGFGCLRIKRTDLVNVLLEEVQKAKIPVHFDRRLTSIKDNEDGVEITFSDGTTDFADLLLGCDGIHSAVRRLHVDPDQTPTYTGLSGLYSIIPASTLPRSVASQIRGDTNGGMNVTFTQEGMFLFTRCTATEDELYWGFSKEVPLPESENARDGWEVRRKEEVEGFKSALLKLLEGAGGEWGSAMRLIVDQTSVVKFYPIYKLPLGRPWSKGRCLLLGDAAHAMPPHAGQGVSMVLEDAFLLSRLLEGVNGPLDEVFKKFDQIRRPRVDEIWARASQNAGIRKNTGAWGLWLKELGVWLHARGAWVLGMHNWGSGLKDMVYDVEEEEEVSVKPRV